jgi:N-acetylmuramic acid 6-phosphate (MurNAc-6-P) etherase
MVSEISGVEKMVAESALARTGNIKLAALVALGAEPTHAETLIGEAEGNLRLAIARLVPDRD